MNDGIKPRLEQMKAHATILSEAYRLRLVGRLWWANLMLVVLPAACATAAAITAVKARPYVAAWLAGGAAVLTAMHKALKCEEYQAECLRLGQAYQSIAIKVDSAISTAAAAGSKADPLADLTTEMAGLANSAKAALPDRYIREAEKRTGYTLYEPHAPKQSMGAAQG
jgi:hypothetical protein